MVLVAKTSDQTCVRVCVCACSFLGGVGSRCSGSFDLRPFPHYMSYYFHAVRAAQPCIARSAFRTVCVLMYSEIRRGHADSLNTQKTPPPPTIRATHRGWMSTVETLLASK